MVGLVAGSRVNFYRIGDFTEVGLVGRETAGGLIRCEDDRVPAVVGEVSHEFRESLHPDTGARAALHVEGSWSYRDAAGQVVIGTDGSIHIDNPLVIVDAFEHRREVAVAGFRHDTTEQPLEGYTSYCAEMRSICQCILNDAPPICDERVGAETMAIIDAAYLSEVEGRRSVSLDEFKQYALDLEQREGENASEVMVEQFMAAITGKS